MCKQIAYLQSFKVIEDMQEEVETESSDDSSIDPDYTLHTIYEDVIAFRASALKNGDSKTKYTVNEQGKHYSIIRL